MSWSSRRAILVLSMLGTLAGVSLVGTVYAQKRIIRQPVAPGGGPAGIPGAPGAPAKKPAYELGSLTLPMNEELA